MSDKRELRNLHAVLSLKDLARQTADQRVALMDAQESLLRNLAEGEGFVGIHVYWVCVAEEG